MAEPNLHVEEPARKRRGGPIQPVEPRFWARVDKKGPDECWEWTGNKAGKGYGAISVNGRRHYVHRVSLYLAEEFDLDSPLFVLHRCDNPRCVNPAHLFTGTQNDNIQDAKAKGRMAFQIGKGYWPSGDDHPSRRWSAEVRARIIAPHTGENSSRSKLTEADIAQMFELRTAGMLLREIADRFSVSRSNVCLILNRKAWRHLTLQSD